MIPAGYMAKRICRPPDAIGLPPHIEDIYSVTACVNDNFADYVNSWKHNDFLLFNSPALVREVAQELAIDLAGTSLFYYEVWEHEFAKEVGWRSLTPSKFDLGVKPIVPATRSLEGYDVISTWVENSLDPEHSPLSCNGLAKEIQTNAHCLFDSLEQAKASIDGGEFESGEPGTLRIVAVYSVDWPVNEAR